MGREIDETWIEQAVERYRRIDALLAEASSSPAASSRPARSSSRMRSPRRVHGALSAGPYARER